MSNDDLRDEIFALVVESNRRCNDLRVRIVRGEITDEEAISEYATATAPLASAARRIRDLQESVDA